MPTIVQVATLRSKRCARLWRNSAAMEGFAHLSVLISIVLGLGITNLLMGLARVVQLRAWVKVYWPTILWALTLLVIHIQTWWSMFGLRFVKTWDFVSFSLTLAQPILLFFLSALVLPDFDRDEARDLRANYFVHVRWFFGIFIALLLVSLARTYAVSGRLPQEADFVFHLIFLTATASATIFQNETYHKVIAALAAVAILTYVALLFMPLR